MINILEILESLTVKRVYDLDVDVLRSMTAPIIEGKEQRQIMDIFCCEKSIEEDKNGNLASFVVLAPNGFPLVFFSLRCGELFKGVSMHKMNIAHEAYLALEKLMNDRCVMQEEKDVALNKLRKAQDEGLNLDDIGNLEEKYKSWSIDKRIDGEKEVNRVLESYPAIELKLFGINKSAEVYWESIGFPRDIKMGETLFWNNVVRVLQDVRSYIGCQYVYLFAADEEPDGQLVQYYKVRLGFDANVNISTNKPHFDWKCQFLYQEMDSLFSGKKHFFHYLKNELEKLNES